MTRWTIARKILATALFPSSQTHTATRLEVGRLTQRRKYLGHSRLTHQSIRTLLTPLTPLASFISTHSVSVQTVHQHSYEIRFVTANDAPNYLHSLFHWTDVRRSALLAWEGQRWNEKPGCTFAWMDKRFILTASSIGKYRKSACEFARFDSRECDEKWHKIFSRTFFSHYHSLISFIKTRTIGATPWLEGCCFLFEWSINSMFLFLH